MANETQEHETTKDELSDCVSSHIPELKREHPDWDDEQVQAVAYSKCGEKAQKDMRYPQAEVNYTTLSTTEGAACANCRWFHMNMCHIVEHHPLEILPTGYCDQHTPIPVVETPEQEPLPVYLVGAMALEEDKADGLPSTKAGRMISTANASALTKLMDGIRDAHGKLTEGMGSMMELLSKAGIGYGKPEDEEEETEPADEETPPEDEEKKPKKSLAQTVKQWFTKPESAFQVYKQADGTFRWLASYTNNFEDLEGEILSEKAHEGYLARLKMGLTPMPELWVWHIKGSRHGVADTIVPIGNFMLATGTFDSTPEGQAAAKYYAKHAHEQSLSHGFTYPEWALKNGIYEVYNTFEISTLPKGKAANPYTKFEEVITVNDEQRQDLIAKLGQDKAASVISSLEAQSEELKGLAKYKDFANVTGQESKPDTEQEKALASLFGEVVESQGELLATIKGMTTVIEALQSENKALTDKLTALDRYVKKAPGKASESDETIVTDPDLETALKDSLADLDPEWAALGLKVVKKPTINGGKE